MANVSFYRVALQLPGLLLLASSLSAVPPVVSAPGVDALASATPTQIKAFFASPEYCNRHRTDEEFIADAYQGILRRAPEAKGLDDWKAALKNNPSPVKAREDLVKSFLESWEYQGAHPQAGVPRLGRKDTTRHPANTLFDKTGVFVNDATAFPVDHYAARLRMAKVTWIALQIDNGGRVRADSAAAVERGWAQQWRKAGFKVGFWGCPRGVAQHGKQSAVAEAIPNVKADAELAVSLCARLGADLYLVDVEDHYQGYSATDPAPQLNRVYVEAFRIAAAAAGISNMARALSSMGRVALDMEPWIQDGWDAMPQAYWNSYAVYQPSLCVDFYLQTGWPLGRIHPTIGTFTGEGENRTVTLADYAKDLRTRATIGFSYYLPESYLGSNDLAYQQLAEMGTPK